MRLWTAFMAMLAVYAVCLAGCATTKHPDGTVETRLDVPTAIAMIDVLKNEVPALIERWDELHARLEAADNAGNNDAGLKDALLREVMRQFMAHLRSRASPDPAQLL